VNANQETGGSVLELSGAEYMVRASGYLKTLDDFRAVPLVARGGVPVRWATWPRSRSVRRCAAASPNSTARARSPAAW
jgi:Cu/Ag efflux pump CusA